MGSDRHWVLPLWSKSLAILLKGLGFQERSYLDQNNEQNHVCACMMHAEHDIIQSDAIPDCVQRKPKPTLACG